MPDDPKKALDEAVRRGNAYAEAGGDCIFYLNLHAAETIGTVAKEVKAPVSILAGPQSPSVKELQDLGVARVSYGSGFMKAAITGAKRLAQEILQRARATCSKTACRRRKSRRWSRARNNSLKEHERCRLRGFIAHRASGRGGDANPKSGTSRRRPRSRRRSLLCQNWNVFQ